MTIEKPRYRAAVASQVVSRMYITVQSLPLAIYIKGCKSYAGGVALCALEGAARGWLLALRSACDGGKRKDEDPKNKIKANVALQ
jgi:hypothetical protein